MGGGASTKQRISSVLPRRFKNPNERYKDLTLEKDEDLGVKGSKNVDNSTLIKGDIIYLDSKRNRWVPVICECSYSVLNCYDTSGSLVRDFNLGATSLVRTNIPPPNIVYKDKVPKFSMCVDDITKEKDILWISMGSQEEWSRWRAALSSSIKFHIERTFKGSALEGNVNGVDSLSSWLSSHGLPLSQWGTGAAKTVSHLFKELLEGDCDIVVEDGRVVRVLSVANVSISRFGGDDKVLMETHQEFSDGRMRTRPSLMSEKLHRGEGVLQGSLRGLHEELGQVLPRDDSSIALDPHFSSRVEETLSPSFPGLLSRYMLWDVAGTVDGLPDGPFCSDELRPDGSLKLRHHWKWIPPNLEKAVRDLYATAGRKVVSVTPKRATRALPLPRPHPLPPTAPSPDGVKQSGIGIGGGVGAKDKVGLEVAAGGARSVPAPAVLEEGEECIGSGNTDVKPDGSSSSSKSNAMPAGAETGDGTGGEEHEDGEQQSKAGSELEEEDEAEEDKAGAFIDMAGMRMFSPSDLEALMGRHGINTSVWGRNQAKSVQQLWDELVSGATTLELVETEVADEPEGSTVSELPSPVGEPVQRPVRKMFTLTRILSVVCVKVLQPRGHLQLLETHQQFADGRVRPRNKLLACKMRRGETIPQTAVRGLLGELGSVVHSERAIHLMLRDEVCHSPGKSVGGMSRISPKVGLVRQRSFFAASPHQQSGSHTGGAASPTPDAAAAAAAAATAAGDPPSPGALGAGDAAQYFVKVETAHLQSPSFPGLPSRYMLYTMSAVVKGLPEGDFHTIQYSHGEVKHKHYWKWRTDAQVQAMLDQVKFKETQSKKAKKRGTGLIKRINRQSGEDIRDSVFRDLGLEGSLPLEEDDLVGMLLQQRYTEEEIEDEILKEGVRDSDGLISPEHFEVIRSRIEKLFLVGRADDGDESGVVPTFNETETEIIKRMFPMCLRIEAQRLTGGFSGSRVLQMQSVDMQGRLEQPCIVKLGKASEVRVEARRMEDARPYLGENAPKLMQAEYSGGDDGIGSLRVQLAGACWCLPDLMRVKSPPLNTFEHLYLHELRSVKGSSDGYLWDGNEDDPSQEGSSGGAVAGEVDEPNENEQVFGDVPQVLQDLFESVLYSATVEHPEAGPRKVNLYDHYDIRHHLKKGVLCRNKHPDTGDRLPADKIRLPVDVDELGMYDNQERSSSSSSDLLEDQVSIVEQVTGVRESPSRFFARFQDMMDAKQPGDDESHRFGLVHGDLNGRNILIDSANFVWVIDFDHTCMDHALKDVSKLEWCILFQYTELLDESELGSALGLTTTLARNVEKYMPSAAALGLLQAEHAHLEMAWNTLSRLRALTPSYGREPGVTMTTSQLLPSLNFALRSLLYPDVSLLQKKWVMGYAVAITHVLMQASLTFSPSKQLLWEEQGAEHNEVVEAMDAKLYMIEQRKYFSSMLVRHTFIVDPISRENINVMEQRHRVRLGGVVEESSGDIAQPGTKLLPGPPANGGGVAAAQLREPGTLMSGMEAVMPTSTEDGAQLLLVGPASCGKTVLLRKALVMMCQNTSGTKQDFVPILISMIEFGRVTAKKRLGVKDNMVQAYLANKFGRHTARFRFLCQAIAENRAVLLLDGLEESGLQKAVIQEYISRRFSELKSQQRVILSARPSSAHRHAFVGFQLVEILPLSRAIQQQVVTQRVGKNPNVDAATILKHIERPEFVDMASDPLLLSLLISTLVSRIEAKSDVGLKTSKSRRISTRHKSGTTKEEERPPDGGEAPTPRSPTTQTKSSHLKLFKRVAITIMAVSERRPFGVRYNNGGNNLAGILTRTALYQHGVELMLHRSAAMKYTFLKGGDAAASDGIEEDLQCLRKPEAMVLLEALALRTHRLRRRDFTSADMAVCMEEMGVSSDPTFFTIANTLLSSSAAGMVPIVVCTQQKDASSDRDSSMRFAHLSFQEYLASRRVSHLLTQALPEGSLTFRRQVVTLLSGAHDPCPVLGEEDRTTSGRDLDRMDLELVKEELALRDDGDAAATAAATPPAEAVDAVVADEPMFLGPPRKSSKLGAVQEQQVSSSPTSPAPPRTEARGPVLDLCFDPWYKQVVLMAGGGLPFAPLAALQELIRQYDNTSGAGEALCVAMLRECTSDMLGDADRETLLGLACAELQRHRLQSGPQRLWLGHPCPAVQRVKLVELRELFPVLDVDAVPSLIQELIALLRTGEMLPWFIRCALLRSMSQLPLVHKEGPTEVSSRAVSLRAPSLKKIGHTKSSDNLILKRPNTSLTALGSRLGLESGLPPGVGGRYAECLSSRYELPSGMVSQLVHSWRTDPSAWVQRQAADSLRHLAVESNRTVIGSIETMLSGPASADPRLRCKAVCAVGELKIMDRGVIQLLLRELCTSQDFSGVTQCLRKLLTPATSATDTLDDALAAVGGATIPVASLGVMGVTPPSNSNPVTLRTQDLQSVLCDCIKQHPDPSARAACLRVFHDTPAASSEPVAAAMCAWLSDDDPLQRASCVMALEEWCTVDRNVWYGNDPGLRDELGNNGFASAGMGAGFAAAASAAMGASKQHLAVVTARRRTWCHGLEDSALHDRTPSVKEEGP